jgi:hypothetical protein
MSVVIRGLMWLFVACSSCWRGDAGEGRAVLFAIEKYWHSGAAYGSGGFCSSGGMNHAQQLLSSYMAVASIVRHKRRTVMVRPAYIFAQSHGEIPESCTWADLFPWDVDSDEFKSPDDVWRALSKNPRRFDVLDVYLDPMTLLNRLRSSTAEIALIHTCVGSNAPCGRVPRNCLSLQPQQYTHTRLHPRTRTGKLAHARAAHTRYTHEYTTGMASRTRAAMRGHRARRTCQ